VSGAVAIAVSIAVAVAALNEQVPNLLGWIAAMTTRSAHGRHPAPPGPFRNGTLRDLEQQRYIGRPQQAFPGTIRKLLAE
jgi:hypothetical protein